MLEDDEEEEGEGILSLSFDALITIPIPFTLIISHSIDNFFFSFCILGDLHSQRLHHRDGSGPGRQG